MYQKISDEFKNNKIIITKYNYSFDKEVQNFDSQDAFIEISQNGDYMKIFNVKLRDDFENLMEKEVVTKDINKDIQKKHKEDTCDNNQFNEDLKQEELNIILEEKEK